ncbi:MAG: hypothetical protein BWY75_03441 [bacterium ADurb.Bin425]|nr:MAG: hypothetical protein BWY75_03441 [bacterium ADurb.Bin425]
MGKKINCLAVDSCLACDHTIAIMLLVGHAKFLTFVQGIAVDFHERAWVNQGFHSFSSSQYAFLVAAFHCFDIYFFSLGSSGQHFFKRTEALFFHGFFHCYGFSI